MKRVKIAELKDQLSRHLRAVERGGQVEVTDRDRPIARIVPIDTSPARVTLIAPTRSLAAVRDRQRGSARWATTSLELLLEERGDR